MDDRIRIIKEAIAKEKEFIEKGDPFFEGWLEFGRALRSLLKDKHPKSEFLLFKLLESRFPTFRMEAASVTKVLKKPSDTLITRLQRMMETDEDENARVSAAQSLFVLIGCDALDAIAKAKDRLPQIWGILANRLVRMKDPRAIRLVESLVKTGGEDSRQILMTLWSERDPRARQLTPGFSDLTHAEQTRAFYVNLDTIFVPRSGVHLMRLGEKDERSYRDALERGDVYILGVSWSTIEYELELPEILVDDENAVSLLVQGKVEEAFEKPRRALRLLQEGKLHEPDSFSMRDFLIEVSDCILIY